MKLSCSLIALLLSVVATDNAVGASSRAASKPVKQSVIPTAFQKIESGGITTPTSSSSSKKSELISISQGAAVGWGMLFTALAGFSNGCFMSGFLELLPKQGVAAVTGAWTNSALGLASKNMKLFYGQSAIIASFIFGSMIYGLMNPRPQLFKLDRKVTSSALGLSSMCFLGAFWILDHAGKNNRAAAYEVCCLAAIASGLQNSLTSAHTGNLCRTTHLTGISSDVGTFLGQSLRGNKTNLFKLQTFAKLAVCFWVGGYVAYSLCQTYKTDAILIPAVLNLVLALYTQFVH
eukprot:CAMPEP_0198144800 /NCGR_PEP_ID=MMETSP1443-20131203/18676_1 /TAXON_ID=186043 /ORGANISM="Entomoneis sp., Strain CCMP2396" /LENGTH=290 /DNA_ID=CAMNT_0043808263 /DNA_START=59 /DNA_END=931 /DNA_ORIENTATION=-